MTDRELIEALVELDADDDKSVSDGDCRMLESARRLSSERRFILSPKQRKWAEDILERYDGEAPEDDD